MARLPRVLLQGVKRPKGIQSGTSTPGPQIGWLRQATTFLWQGTERIQWNASIAPTALLWLRQLAWETCTLWQGVMFLTGSLEAKACLQQRHHSLSSDGMAWEIYFMVYCPVFYGREQKCVHSSPRDPGLWAWDSLAEGHVHILRHDDILHGIEQKGSKERRNMLSCFL